MRIPTSFFLESRDHHFYDCSFLMFSELFPNCFRKN